MKLLFATKNPAKVNTYKEKLKKHNIDIFCSNDIDIVVKVEESGKDAIENAKIKAKAYYDATGIVSMGMDDTLYLEGIPEEKQPGTHVRRVDGKELSDEEMISHYSMLVKDSGKDRLIAKWIYGIAIYDGKEFKTHTWDKKSFYLVANPSEKRNPGYPLDSISIDSKLGKYFVDIDKKEKEDTDSEKKHNEVVEFIVKNI
jgi:inosine/xanthosine triphosphate pyrophosphatase family protein